MDYYAFGKEFVAHSPDSRTIRGQAPHDNLWVKLPVPPKARIWHRLQWLIAACVRNPIFRVTVSEGSGNALRMEATRLQEFHEKGFNVPCLKFVNDEMLVITDIGPQLRAYLDRTDDAQARLTAMKAAMRELARLHRAGLSHGRPYLRDMTWDGEKIGFLDLEENPASVMPLPSAQARDVWIFLGAAARYARDPADKYVYHPDIINTLRDEYIQHAGDNVMPALYRFVDMLRPVRWAMEKDVLWRRVGNDVRQSVFATQCLEKR